MSRNLGKESGAPCTVLAVKILEPAFDFGKGVVGNCLFGRLFAFRGFFCRHFCFDRLFEARGDFLLAQVLVERRLEGFGVLVELLHVFAVKEFLENVDNLFETFVRKIRFGVLRFGLRDGFGGRFDDCFFLDFYRLLLSGNNRVKIFTHCFTVFVVTRKYSLFLEIIAIFAPLMRIDILTVVPELLESPLGYSIVKRACDKGLVEIHVHNIREYGKGRWRQVDDYSFGGDAGMVMMIEPVFNLMAKLKAERTYDEIIFTSPDGEPFTQQVANELSCKENLMILCGHYKGVDHRIREHLITREITVGDYVLSGGELPAAIMTDAIVRLLPGALGDETSALSDSFQDGLLAPPVYTRPAEFNGWKVPEILLSGDPKKIAAWQDEQALARTRLLRPELLK